MTYRLHVLGLPHTQTTAAFATCGFTEKVRKFCRMMHERGHEVFLYAGEQNEAPCTEHVPCISEEMRAATVGDRHYSLMEHDSSRSDWQFFTAEVITKIAQRLQTHDIVCCFAGVAHKSIADAFPHLMSIEPGIGYSGTFAKHRVWESYAWMHACYAAQSPNGPDVDGQWYDAVIPGFFETERFPLQIAKGSYLLYAGRAIERKGIYVASQVAKAAGRKLLAMGPGGVPAGVESLGEVSPEARASLMGGAHALLAPTIYMEPFGNVAVEAMLCGTPVISTDWGAFTETVVPGLTGFRCRSLQEFVDAVGDVQALSPEAIREHAVSNYSLEAAGVKYERYLDRLNTLWAGGWAERRPAAAKPRASRPGP